MDPVLGDAGCEVLQDDLAALAIGALTGSERARVLIHLEHCPTCVAELDELSATADRLTSLIPDAVPSEGFSDVTMVRLRAHGEVAHRPRFRQAVTAAAAVVLLALGMGVGALVFSAHGTGTVTALRSATLHSTSGTAGTVLLGSTGDRGWLAMSIDDVPTQRTVTCSIVLDDGTRREVGRFTVT
ncbi:MAG TPA: zf-HC2 domain-containing protein, partial [Acidimicrobiales bacterium]|nr:zf-HC2 domain-containing protein [Acidimicrobiales bacterium]